MKDQIEEIVKSVVARTSEGNSQNPELLYNGYNVWTTLQFKLAFKQVVETLVES